MINRIDRLGELGFIIPGIGQIHQEYLRRLYQGLTPIPRKIITSWVQPNGWMDLNNDLVLLSSSSLWWKIVNRCYRAGRHFSQSLIEHDNCVPVLPVGWKRRFRTCIKEHNIGTLLFIYGGTAITFLSEIERLDIPVAVNFGGSDAQMGDYNPWYAEQLARLWKRADLCIFVSEFLMKQACDRGCPVEKSKVIYRGCVIPNDSHQQCNGADIRFVCAANLLPVKGHEYLIKAFANVKERLNNARLTLIGSGPLKVKLQHLVQELELSDLVEFRGSMKWEDVQRVLSECDIHVQPSVKTADGREEGFPNATLEAQALGLPVIVSRSGGLLETIEEGQTGLVVPARDAKALAKAMVRLGENFDLRCRMSKLASQRAREKFDVNKQNTIWRQTIKDLMCV